jgi:hypothetical protein
MDSDNKAEDIAKAPAKVVLFADLLGFAALTEQYPIDALSLRTSDRLDTMFGAVFKKNPLTRAFTEFHRSIRGTLQLSQLRHSSTAITFSDSAFVATTKLHEAVGIAVYLMQSLLRRGVPMRMGIASGSFEAVRFRSDITVDGGDHAAHFLGTGVVWAHGTESCGINGCRILLHPSAAILLDDPLHNPPAPASEHVMHLECSAAECQNKRGIVHEINYWDFGSTKEKRAWCELQKMWDEAPETERRHFQATAEAIDRMRVARGEAPISNLRRRTIAHNSSRKA